MKKVSKFGVGLLATLLIPFTPTSKSGLLDQIAHAPPDGHLAVYANIEPLANMADGISNTIMFVELTDDAAVEWTKPEDYELNKVNPRWCLWGARQADSLRLSVTDLSG